MIKSFRIKTKLFVILALIAIVVSVVGILLLRGLASAPVEQPVITNFEECLDAGYLILEGYPRQCQTPDGRVLMEEIAEADKNSCNTTGCSGQACSNQEVITTCEFLPEYVCYRNAVCERQSNGECGWTLTNELTQCLEEQSAEQNLLDTSTWQTYRNDEFGFEVKYPKDWRDTNWKNHDGSTYEFSKYEFSGTQSNLSNQVALIVSVTFRDIYLADKFFTQLQQLDNGESIAIGASTITKLRDENISGFPAIRYLDPIDSVGLSTYDERAMVRNKDILVNFWLASPPKEFENNKKVFHQFLSTFRFIK